MKKKKKKTTMIFLSQNEHSSFDIKFILSPRNYVRERREIPISKYVNMIKWRKEKEAPVSQ